MQIPTSETVFDSIRRRFANASPEVRTRAELCVFKIKELRSKHACLLRLPPATAFALQQRAVREDTIDHLTHRHTNSMGITWFKYNK